MKDKKLKFAVYRFVIGLILPLICIHYILDGWRDYLLFAAIVVLWVVYEDLIEFGERILGSGREINEDEEE